MEIQQGIKEFLIEIEVRKYTPRTIRGYRNNRNIAMRRAMEPLIQSAAFHGAKKKEQLSPHLPRSR